jgi:hypothetical protein
VVSGFDASSESGFKSSYVEKKRAHCPLAFLSGNFTGSQLCWSTSEKEGFPIITALDKLEHFLKREDPFHLFCDHRNLIYILSPDRDLNKTSSDRLFRWSSRLIFFRKLQLGNSKSASSDEVVKYLFEWISSNGIPRVQVSDQGSQFTL